MTSVTDRLDGGDILVIDGGMGTELQRRGVGMDGEAWAGAALETAPDAIRRIHRAFIEAGADIVIANTYAAAPHVLKHAGFDEARTLGLNRAGCGLAREAVEQAGADRPVHVAGSLSSFRAGLDLDKLPTEAEARSSYTAQAEALAEGGCDFLVCEMLLDDSVSPIAAECAVATGLPVWLGLSARVEDGRVMGFSERQTLSFEAVMDACLIADAQAAGVMHSDIATTPAALEALKTRWSGPLFAYPHSGAFVMPHWRFDRVIAPEDYAREALGYLEAGCRAIGGCCGLGPEHIAAARAVLPHRLPAA